MEVEGVELDIVGELGRLYRLQASSDLAHWLDLFSFSNSTTTTVYLDAHASDFRMRFYRVVSP